ncbi:MAG: MFS transporter [Kineosporiaceae bacterium]
MNPAVTAAPVDAPALAATPRAVLRALVWPVFVPVGIFGLGSGASGPVIVFLAHDLGASVVVASAIVALAGVGMVLGDLPAGAMVARFGERAAVLAGSLIGAAGAGLAIVSAHLDALGGPARGTAPLAVLGAGVLLTGVAMSVWGLARHAYLATAVPFAVRGTAIAAMAAAMRAGFFAGPFVGAAAVGWAGPQAGFWVELASIVVAALLMAGLPALPGELRGRPVRAPDTAAGPSRRGRGREVGDRPGIVRRHGRLLATLGAGAAGMGAARACRTAMIPLWAAQQGVGAATTSLIMGASAAVDLAATYPAGRLLDTRGRRLLAVGSLAPLAVAFLLLPLSGTVAWISAVALLSGVANGFGNGVIMTLGADVAPDEGRAEFLGAWRLCHDSGMALGPALVTALALAGGLAPAVLGTGVVSLLGSAALHRWIPRYVPWPPPDRLGRPDVVR